LPFFLDRSFMNKDYRFSFAGTNLIFIFLKFILRMESMV
jgi:hypothetical protein